MNKEHFVFEFSLLYKLYYFISILFYFGASRFLLSVSLWRKNIVACVETRTLYTYPITSDFIVFWFYNLATTV